MIAAKKTAIKSKSKKKNPFLGGRLAMFWTTWAKLTNSKLNDQEKGLHDFVRSRRHVYKCYDSSDMQEISEVCVELEDVPISSPPLWSLAEPAHLYRGSQAVSQPGMKNRTGEIEYNTIPINTTLGYGDKLSRDEFESPARQGKGPQKGSQQTDQRGQDDIEKLSELHWESSSNVSSPPP
ncbi:hypothetical protein AYI69_g2204 [Smittium culicis]|uniref:Uncharacterized protein n=1 Tax=Smittium culicis TaxID=133412 RepID=A0A1R1YN63_9FUNG|nr:hypothetical protein AYI69_g2204 [Smittium culicis]